MLVASGLAWIGLGIVCSRACNGEEPFRGEGEERLLRGARRLVAKRPGPDCLEAHRRGLRVVGLADAMLLCWAWVLSSSRADVFGCR